MSAMRRFSVILNPKLELRNVEGFGEYLRDGRLEKLHFDDISESHGVANDNSNSFACVRQLESGTLSDTSVGGQTELSWDRQVASAEQDSVRLTWSTAADPAQKTIAEMIESLDHGAEVWQFTPRDPGQIGGHFLISSNALQGHLPKDDPSTSLWNDGDIEWEEMSGGDYYRNGSFDMWYFLHFAVKQSTMLGISSASTDSGSIATWDFEQSLLH